MKKIIKYFQFKHVELTLLDMYSIIHTQDFENLLKKDLQRQYQNQKIKQK